MAVATETKTLERIKRSRREWWWVAEVAGIIGKSRRQVYYDIEDGKLLAERYGARKTRVHKRALLEYLKRWNTNH